MGKIRNAKETISESVREAKVRAEVRHLGNKEAKKIRNGAKAKLGIQAYIKKHDLDL